MSELLLDFAQDASFQSVRGIMKDLHDLYQKTSSLFAAQSAPEHAAVERYRPDGQTILKAEANQQLEEFREKLSAISECVMSNRFRVNVVFPF
eukprot:scaffold2404_cov398-Prasinococcus_capsulatus_cf.AAC.30